MLVANLVTGLLQEPAVAKGSRTHADRHWAVVEFGNLGCKVTTARTAWPAFVRAFDSARAAVQEVAF